MKLQPKPAALSIDNGSLEADCQVWSLSLDQPADVLSAMERTLSPDELDRAQAYRLLPSRRQFVLTRGALRGLLGCRLGIAPAACRFAPGESGKPFLREPACDLRFNVAHSGKLALIAIAQGVEVGIDIEIHRPLDDRQALANMILSSSEWRQWQRLSAAESMSAFYDLWTRKEAVTKAFGRGLLMEFSSVEVSFRAGQPARLLGISGDEDVSRHWTLKALDSLPGYSAALAAPAARLRISQRILEPRALLP